MSFKNVKNLIRKLISLWVNKAGRPIIAAGLILVLLTSLISVPKSYTMARSIGAEEENNIFIVTGDEWLSDVDGLDTSGEAEESPPENGDGSGEADGDESDENDADEGDETIHDESGEAEIEPIAEELLIQTFDYDEPEMTYSAAGYFANGRELRFKGVGQDALGNTLTNVFYAGDENPIDLKNINTNASGDTTKGFLLTLSVFYLGGYNTDCASASATIDGGVINTVYGGSYNGNVAGDVNITVINGGNPGIVYAGGYATAGASANVGGSTSITIDGGRVTANLHGGGYANGAGASANVSGKTNIIFESSTNFGNSTVYGGGFAISGAAASVGGGSNIEIKNVQSTNTNNNGVTIYGGGYANGSTSAVGGANIDIELLSTTRSITVYGGGYCTGAAGSSSTGDVKINIGQLSTSGTSSSTGPVNIYGGGYGVNGSCSVNNSEISFSSTVSSGYSTNIYGGGYTDNASGNVTVESSVINFTGTVTSSTTTVYGGGYAKAASTTCKVPVTNSTINFSGITNGGTTTVYGGGCTPASGSVGIATVNNSSINIDGILTNLNVSGSGQNTTSTSRTSACVLDTSTINIEGGTITGLIGGITTSGTASNFKVPDASRLFYMSGGALYSGFSPTAAAGLSTFTKRVSPGKSTPIYKVTLSFSDGAAKTITNFITNVPGFSYGSSNMATNASGQFAVMLPLDMNVNNAVRVVAGGSTYTARGSVKVTADNNAAATLAQEIFVPVTGIDGVITELQAESSIVLPAEANPANATNSAVTWSVSDAGGTGADITGNTLTAVSQGMAEITATVTDGLGWGSDYTEVFIITVTPPLPTITDDNTGVSVKGNIDDTQVLVVKDISDDLEQYQDFDIGAAVTVLAAYGIELDGASFTGKLTLSLPVEDRYNGAAVTVSHLPENGGSVVSFAATVVNGMVTFEVDELGQFLAVYDSVTKVSNASGFYQAIQNAGTVPAVIELVNDIRYYADSDGGNIFISNGANITISGGAAKRKLTLSAQNQTPFIVLPGGKLSFAGLDLEFNTALKNIEVAGELQILNCDVKGTAAAPIAPSIAVDHSGAQGKYSIKLTDSTFSGFKCAVVDTGVSGTPSRAGTVEMTGCTFENIACSQSGAITLSPVNFAKGASGIIRDCTFQNNSAKRGGALYLNSSEDVLIEDSSLLNNNADDRAGAIYITRNTTDNTPLSNSPEKILRNINILGCATTNTQQYTMGGGGGIYLDGQRVLIDGGKISECKTNVNGGGVYLTYNSKLNIKNKTEISKNTASFGGGIYLPSAAESGRPYYPLAIESAWIHSNEVSNTGGGILIYEGNKAEFKNVIIRNNTASTNARAVHADGGGIWVCGNGSIQTYFNSGAAIYGNTASYSGDDLYVSWGDRSITISPITIAFGNAEWYLDEQGNRNITKAAESDYTDRTFEPGNGDDNLALKSRLSANDIAKVESFAASNPNNVIIIENNKAAYGAGITINGEVGLGEDGTLPAGVKLIKKDKNTGRLLSGARFELFDENGSKINGYTTDNNGEIIVNNLKDGTNYYFLETIAPAGYKLPDAPGNKYSFTAKFNNGNLKEITATNEKLAASLIVTKTINGTDSNGNPHTPDTSVKFEFTVAIGGSNSAEYTYYINGKLQAKKFKSGSNIMLGHGEHAEFIGIPHGTSYNVSEKNYYYSTEDSYKSAGANTSGAIQLSGSTVSFTNTFAPVSTGGEGDEGGETPPEGDEGNGETPPGGGHSGGNGGGNGGTLPDTGGQTNSGNLTGGNPPVGDSQTEVSGLAVGNSQADDSRFIENIEETQQVSPYPPAPVTPINPEDYSPDTPLRFSTMIADELIPTGWTLIRGIDENGFEFWELVPNGYPNISGDLVIKSNPKTGYNGMPTFWTILCLLSILVLFGISGYTLHIWRRWRWLNHQRRHTNF